LSSTTFPISGVLMFVSVRRRAKRDYREAFGGQQSVVVPLSARGSSPTVREGVNRKQGQEADGRRDGDSACFLLLPPADCPTPSLTVVLLPCVMAESFLSC
jgi:hypothetical protein